MLKQNVDSLRFITLFITSNSENPGSPRFSLLDAALLLMINEHPQTCKADLTEIMYGVRNYTKSSFDRPLNRLVQFGLITRTPNSAASTKAGQGRVFYSLSKKGVGFLKKCSYK